MPAENNLSMKKTAWLILVSVALSGMPFLAQAATDSAGTNVVNNGTVYMVTAGGQLRPYTSAGAFLSYGFNNWSGVVQASADDLALPTGAFIPPRDGNIICSNKGSDTGTCYLITNGEKAAFTSEGVFSQLGFSFSNALYGDVSFLPAAPDISSATQAHLPGTLVNNNGTIELVGATGTIGIPDMSTLSSWGYVLSDVVPANTADQQLTQSGVLPTHISGELSWANGVSSTPSVPTQPTQPTQPTIPSIPATPSIPVTVTPPVALSSPNPITLNGSSQEATQPFVLQQGLSIFTMSYTGRSNFIVWLVDSNGNNVALLANTEENFNGSIAQGIQSSGQYLLNVQASGPWSVTITQPRSATAPSTTSFSGNSQQATSLFHLSSGLHVFNMNYTGGSNFIIWLMDQNGNNVDLLTNSEGAFNGSQAEGISNDGLYLLNVQASGNWTVSIQ
jgi:hypothetical protein